MRNYLLKERIIKLIKFAAFGLMFFGSIGLILVIFAPEILNVASADKGIAILGYIMSILSGFSFFKMSKELGHILNKMAASLLNFHNL